VWTSSSGERNRRWQNKNIREGEESGSGKEDKKILEKEVCRQELLLERNRGG
jgi:hypothetical protein